MKPEQKTEEALFYEEGQINAAVGGVVMLIVGVGVATLVLIFVGSLGGQTYQLVESDIDAITNTTIKESIKNSIVSGFEGLEQTGKFLPIVVLAVIIAIVLSLVLTFGMGGMYGGAYRGSAL